MQGNSEKVHVPVWEKFALTVDEAASYFGLGVNRIREISNSDNCDFVLWVGKKRMIKRKLFEQYLEGAYSI